MKLMVESVPELPNKDQAESETFIEPPPPPAQESQLRSAMVMVLPPLIVSW
jgi:hypothetical protein